MVYKCESPMCGHKDLLPFPPWILSNSIQMKGMGRKKGQDFFVPGREWLASMPPKISP